VQDNLGRWHSMRVRPYRTAENKIDGVVITLIDIDQMKRTISALEEARDFAQAVIESAREPMAAVNEQLRITTANAAFCRLFKTTHEDAEKRLLFEVIDREKKMPELRTALEGILPTGGSLTDHEVRVELPDEGSMRLLASARAIASGSRSYPLILLSLRPAPLTSG
jgi:two-component system CheB/CheR fusion protein